MELRAGALEGLVVLGMGPKRAGSQLTWIRGLAKRFLPAKVHQILRFGVAGLVSTLFYFVASAALVVFGEVQPVQASVLAYFLSLGVSYGLQSRFTFRQGNDSTTQIVRFLITALLGLAISYTLVFLTTEVLHWGYVVGNIAVCVVIPMANYFALKLWVFSPIGRVVAMEIEDPRHE